MALIIRRRHAVQLLVVAAAAASLGSNAIAGGNPAADYRHGKLFMMTNATAADGGNVLQVYARADDGPATLLSSVSTGGNGTGGGLGSQGAVALSESGRYLFAVNAGSSTVSAFRLGHNRLELVSTVASGGEQPISVAESGGIVYVLNAPAAGTGNVVAGFRNQRGTLVPLSDGVRQLQDGSAPAQLAFDGNGDTLVVSEKSANQLVSYAVKHDGTLSTSFGSTPSPGAVPFGFAITQDNVVVVSEAGTSSASSYTILGRTSPLLQLVTPALANGQGAACWVSVTPSGRFAYTANASADNISAYGIDSKGRLTLLAAQAGFTSGNGALDMAVTPDGKQLHVFASRAPQQIVSFTIGQDGSLTKIGSLDISAGAGLAAN